MSGVRVGTSTLPQVRGDPQDQQEYDESGRHGTQAENEPDQYGHSPLRASTAATREASSRGEKGLVM